MYVPSFEYPDRRIENQEGRCFGGVAIGIIVFGVAGYALPPGTVENATTFRYPVYFKPIPAANNDSVVAPEPNAEVLKQLIGAGREMIQQGCRAIVGACGYFANYLPEVREALDVPCFLSSLMQLPLILNSLSPKRKVGIICANGEVLPKANALANCGISDRSRLVIRGGGLPEFLPEMTNEILPNLGGHNPKKLEREVVALAEDMVKENPDIGAFLLECSLYPGFSYAVQRSVRVPVYDFVTLIDWAHRAAVQREYYGYI